MGPKRIGIFGCYKEEGNGWDKIEYLAKRLATVRGYSVLTGKGIFKINEKGNLIFNEILFDPTPHIVSVEDYARWLVCLVPTVIIFLGGIRSTAEPEEDEALKKKPTCGVAVLEELSSENKNENCEKLEYHEPREFAICTNGVGACQEGMYCPFYEKGVPYGRLDLYTRSKHGHLLATKVKEKILEGLDYIGFI